MADNRLVDEENIAYHYCSLQDLLNIIFSKSVWLTSLSSTNDKKELSYGRKQLQEMIQEMMVNDDYLEIRSLLQKIIEEIDKRSYRNYFSAKAYYGASFVGNRDSLVHWERYGNKLRGVCVAINFGMLERYFKDLGLPEFCTTWLWHNQVIYQEDEQKKYIEEYLTNKISSLSADNGFYDLSFSYAAIYYETLAVIRPLFKHTGFGDECEYRLIFEEKQAELDCKYYIDVSNSEKSKRTSRCINKAIEGLNLRTGDKKYGLFDNGIRSYYDMSLCKFWDDRLIPEIIIGPHCRQSTKELKAFLRANGLNKTDVSVSQIPIR